jgi:chemotaxis response regulator CheB
MFSQTILIIDDSALMRDMLSSILADMANIEMAVDGTTGLAAVK